MSWLSIMIFVGYPLAGLIAAMVFVVGSVRRWESAEPPESHYIASRMVFEPIDENDAAWLRELDALKLQYRHLIC